MFKIAEKIFINKKYDKMDNNKRASYGVLSSIFGIIFNVILSFLKIVVGIISSSIAILTDGFNNFTDATSSIVSLIGFRLSKKEADKLHPFGHERVEYISALLVSFLICILAFILGKSSLEKIINNELMDQSRFYIIIVIVSISIIVKIYMAYIYKYIYKKIDSLTSKAQMKDSINDIISSFIILISMIISKIFNISLDAYLGLALSIYMLIVGLRLLSETISPLIGENASIEEIKDIESFILSYDKVLGVHDLLIHKYGKYKVYASIHVEMDSKDDVLKSHEIIDNIERDIFDKKGILLTIHLDPLDLSDDLNLRLNEALREIINQKEFLSFHDFRILRREDEIKVLFDLIIPYKYNKIKEEIRKEIISSFLVKAKKIKDTNYEFLINIDNDN